MKLKLKDFFSLLADSQQIIVYPGANEHSISGTKEALECFLKDSFLNETVIYIETTETKPDTIHVNVGVK